MTALAWASAGCSSHLSAAECRVLLDHYVSMSAEGLPEVAATQGSTHDVLRDSLVSAKRQEPAYVNAELRCEDEVSRSEYDCGMAVWTPNEWEACVQ